MCIRDSIQKQRCLNCNTLKIVEYFYRAVEIQIHLQYSPQILRLGRLVDVHSKSEENLYTLELCLKKHKIYTVEKTMLF